MLWVRAESRARSPLVDMVMMRLRPVWTTNLATFLLGFGLYCAFVLIPQYVQAPTSTGYGFGASVTQAGLYLLPSTIALLIFSPIGGRLSKRTGSKVPLVLGMIVTTLSFVVLAVADSSWEIYLASALLGTGIGFAFAAVANLIVEAVRRDQTGVASGMNTIVRTIGGAIGAEVAATHPRGEPARERVPRPARLHGDVRDVRRRDGAGRRRVTCACRGGGGRSFPRRPPRLPQPM